MSDTTTISWADYTFNPWMGCQKVSPACENCYAERDFDHRYKKVTWGPYGTRAKTSVENWNKPLKWNRDAHEKGIRYRVFCASIADVFEDWKGPILDSHGNKLTNATSATASAQSAKLTMNDLRRDLFELIDATPNLDWLLLTKRPENIKRMIPSKGCNGDCEKCFCDGAVCRKRSNVWLGTSVENQEYAEKRIPELLKCRDLSPILFLSCEPLLGSLEFSDVTKRVDAVSQLGKRALEGIDWVIAGGESGPEARPSHPDWFRSLRDQCEVAKVAFHFKQWGEWLPIDHAEPIHAGATKADVWRNRSSDSELPMLTLRVGTKKAGRLLYDRVHDAFPEVKYA
jgi:protein gp37